MMCPTVCSVRIKWWLWELRVTLNAMWEQPAFCEIDLTWRNPITYPLSKCVRVCLFVCLCVRDCVRWHVAGCYPMRPLSNVICLCSTVRPASALIHCSNSSAIYYDLIWICPSKSEGGREGQRERERQREREGEKENKKDKEKEEKKSEGEGRERGREWKRKRKIKRKRDRVREREREWASHLCRQTVRQTLTFSKINL